MRRHNRRVMPPLLACGVIIALGFPHVVRADPALDHFLEQTESTNPTILAAR